MLRDGMKLILDARVVRIERSSEGKLLHYEVNGDPKQVVLDEILVGAGRAPNVEGLNLEAVGVRYDPRKGVEVDDRLRTTNPRIYAAGDVCMEKKFTHAADAAAQIVVRNALFFGRRKLSQLVIPWCTYTDPEIAHVGMYEREANALGTEVDTYVTPHSAVDRAKADSEEEGFTKIHVKKGSDQILGATIVAPHAGEMINEITLAMVGKLGLGKVFEVIHPYPTQAMAIKASAGAYLRTRLTPFAKRLFNLWFRLTG
jgi:pyruvate/2-oxoglutarate dehydrogenase complex dihydrolipoamide dehydrogenase (E3) component